MESIDIKVESGEIEACHRLPARDNQNKKTIIRFVNRKKCEKSLKNKKKLASVDMKNLEFPEETQLFISENLNPFFRKIGWFCRRLKREKHSYEYQNEAYFIKVRENSNSYKIVHYDKLFENFADFFNEDI